MSHWLLLHMGWYGGGWTNLWGGFLSDLTEFALLGGAIHVYLRFTCHEPKCFWPGHLLPDLHTRSCWRHHPEGRPTQGHVQRKWEEYRRQVQQP